jgi:hypothetical protein
VSSDSLSTTEALVIHGANGVTRAAREGFPDAGWQGGVGLAALVLGLIVLRARGAWRRPAVTLALVAGGFAGLIQVALVRADAPVSRWMTVVPIRQSLETLAHLAPWPSPVAFIREEDDVTFPLTRYAVPTRRPGPAAVTLDVRGSALPITCTPSGQCQGPK